MIKLATIGTSWITESFINGIKTMPQKFKHTTVYSRNQATGKLFADKTGCSNVSCDLLSLANDKEIDAVYIASPNAFHFEQSLLMLQHKKHVICEKPATVTLSQLNTLIETAKSNGVIFMEALIGRHLPTRQTLASALKEIGEISHVRFDFCQLSSKYDNYVKGVHENIFDPKMAAGCLMDLGIYCVYPAIDLFGMPININAFAKFLKTGADGFGTAIFEYPTFLCQLTYSKIGQGSIGSEIVGTNGTISIGAISKLNNMTLHKNDGTKKLLSLETEKHILMSGEANDFYRYITDSTTRDEYNSVTLLAKNVCKAMTTIREKSNIIFD